MQKQGSSRLTVGVFLLAIATMASCNRQPELVRNETYVAVESTVEINKLSLPGLVRNSQGELILTTFIHSTFPSATDTVDAIAVLKSNDGGESWSEVFRIASNLTYGAWGYDLTISERGVLHLTWVAAIYHADSPQPFKAVMYSRSADQGKSWSEPARVSSAISGQRRNPVIVATGDEVHIAWLDDQRKATGQSETGDVYCSSSTNQGKTWQASDCLETDLDQKTSTSSTPAICMGTDGNVYCVYSSLRNGSQGGFWLAKSIDHGKNFTITRHSEGAVGNASIAHVDGRLCLAVVTSTGIENLYSGDLQTNQEIRFHSSSNAGKTWTKPVLIDDDLDDQRKNNVDLLDGGADRLLACWDDGRGGLHVAVSIDGGSTWGKNVPVASASKVGITPFGIAIDGQSGKFFIATSDMRHGAGDSTSLVTGRIVTK